jgi:predicted enzyme related to lactoylglutathione lyase
VSKNREFPLSSLQNAFPPSFFKYIFRKINSMSNTQPTIGNGKICYLEIPSTDSKAASIFYKDVFGWNIRTRGDGATAFDDGVGEVSGAFVKDRKPGKEVGTLIYIMVDNMAQALDLIVKHGGKIVQPVGMDAPEITARFTDLDGNLFGLYQEPGQ